MYQYPKRELTKPPSGYHTHDNNNDSDGEMVYSGGADKRFVSWNIHADRGNALFKLEGKISAIRENPVHPDLLLLR